MCFVYSLKADLRLFIIDPNYNLLISLSLSLSLFSFVSVFYSFSLPWPFISHLFSLFEFLLIFHFSYSVRSTICLFVAQTKIYFLETMASTFARKRNNASVHVNAHSEACFYILYYGFWNSSSTQCKRCKIITNKSSHFVIKCKWKSTE